MDDYWFAKGVVPDYKKGYERAKYLPKKSHRAKSRTWRLLVVYLRPVSFAAILRRVPQGQRIRTPQNGNYRRQNRGLVRLQTFQEQTVLRRQS
jgi:hypothetical protein